MADAELNELPRALRAYFDKTGVALSLARAEPADGPLLLVNEGFSRMTGYAPDEVIGKNCRLLQGPGTTAGDRQALHDFVHDPGADSGRFPILNYRKDGSTFHNYVFMARLRDRAGRARFLLGSQFDMSSALRHMQIEKNDAALNRSLGDIGAIGREFGLAIMGSAAVLAESAAAIARLSLEEDDR